MVCQEGVRKQIMGTWPLFGILQTQPGLKWGRLPPFNEVLCSPC